jgi:hypothetical protein
VREPCKGAKVEKWKGKMRRRRRVQSAGSSTEYGGEIGAKVQIGRRPVQRWKSESTEYRLQSTEDVSYEDRAKVRAGKITEDRGRSTEERQVQRCKSE